MPTRARICVEAFELDQQLTGGADLADGKNMKRVSEAVGL